MYLNILILACLCSLKAEAARILVAVPAPSISHQIVFRPLTQELARRGHEVVVITTDPAFPKGQTPENLTEIDVHDISYTIWREGLVEMATSGSPNNIHHQMKVVFKIATDIFEMQMMTEEVQNVINNRTNQFDLLILEACIDAALGLAHVFKAPVILASSFLGVRDNYDIVGAPNRPALLYPTVLHQRLVDLSLWEKLKELYQHYLFLNIIDESVYYDDRVIKRIFGPDTPSTRVLRDRVNMLFLNVHPLWNFNRPVPPNVVYMGGLHLKPQKELPKDLKSYLDSSKYGVIYISYGTNVYPSELPPENIQILLKVFSQLPYDILWKWDKDELPGRLNNIKISKWLPQADLLNHPKVKLFITQGGLQSTDEAISAGVPLIGMPMMGDQWYNVEQYVYHKIGLRLDMHALTENKLKTAIETVINNKTYRKNVVKLRAIMRDQSQPPLERAVWWTEHVMRHGGAAHLRPRTANMSWAEYLDIELLTLLAMCAIIFVILACVAMNLLVISVRSSLSRLEKLKTN